MCPIGSDILATAQAILAQAQASAAAAVGSLSGFGGHGHGPPQAPPQQGYNPLMQAQQAQHMGGQQHRQHMGSTFATASSQPRPPREHSRNIQGTSREHSGSIQGTFREHSG